MTDETSSEPPRPAAVAGRALALSAVRSRGFIDHGTGDADAESVQARMLDWIARFGLRDHLSAAEWDAIGSPLGTLQPATVNRLTWETEGLAVLAWALQQHDHPDHDRQGNPYEITDSLGFLGDDAGDLLAAAKLREFAELKAFRELMYAIHCRVRDFQRHGSIKAFTTWVEPEWLEILQLDPSRLFADGDLAFQGCRIDSVDKDALRTYEHAIREQHRASIWLIDNEQPHWETPTDT